MMRTCATCARSRGGESTAVIQMKLLRESDDGGELSTMVLTDGSCVYKCHRQHVDSNNWSH